MAVKISGLPSGTALTGTEVVPAVQSGVTVKTLMSQIATYVTSTFSTIGQALVSAASANAAKTTLGLGDTSPYNCTMTGTGDVIVLTPSGNGPAGLVDQMELSFVPTLSTTTAGLPTVNYNGTGAKALYSPNNFYYAFTQAVTKGSPVKVKYILADDRFVIASSQLSFRQAIGLAHPGILLSPITATTFNVSANDSDGLLVWDATKLAFDVTFIGPGGLAAGVANLASITINGVAAQAAASNTLYYVYVSGVTQPAVELSTTGPAVAYNGVLTLTGNVAKSYIGILYTLNRGGGIDIRVDGNGSIQSQLVNVGHSHYFVQPLMLQTDQITTNGVASAAMVEIATTLRADIVMEGQCGYFYKITGYAVCDTVGATVALEAYNASASPTVNCVCQGTCRGVGDSIPLTSTYGRANTTGHYQFQARGSISAGTANFHLTAEVWTVI